ncbi:MAG: hypothetical protein PHD81_00575 [Candidatus Nanoarchaeia archaeon]|nr:hypothetical protein [Candidatus Nanoarchaeia archaeon]MDD5587584.1 hypothetical protein [Candidatus Nanoarchaeia archaeon]
MTNLEIKSLNEFNRIYLPKDYEKQRLSKMTPGQYGEYLSNQFLNNIRKALKGI